MPATRGIVPVHDRESAAADRRFGGAGPPASTYLPAGVASAGAGLAFGLAARVALELGRLTGTAGSVGFSATHSLLGAVGSAEAACRSAGLLHPASTSSAAVAAIEVRVMRIIGRLLRLIQVLLPGLGGTSVIGIKFWGVWRRGAEVDRVGTASAFPNSPEPAEFCGVRTKTGGWRGAQKIKKRPGARGSTMGKSSGDFSRWRRCRKIFQDSALPRAGAKREVLPEFLLELSPP